MAEIGTDIERATAYLKEGKLVAIPTDTVYGLAGNAFDEQSIHSIFEVKRRPLDSPLIAQTNSFDKVKKLVIEIPIEAVILADNFWPGALTLILEKSKLIPDIMTSGGPAVGVRIPNHKMTLELLSKIDFPLAVPSANIHGETSPTTAREVEEQIGDQIAYILDGGRCAIGFESTIVGIKESRPVIFRQGAIQKEDILSAIANIANS